MSRGDITLVKIDAPDQQQNGQWYRVDGLDGDLAVNVLVDRSDPYKPQVKQVQIAGSTVLASHLREVPLGEVERLIRFDITTVGVSPTGEIQLQAPALLRRRLAGEDDVAFAHRVAMSYRYYASKTSAPAKAIAEASGVPVGTVRRWIKEARQIGQLEPARRGRAG